MSLFKRASCPPEEAYLGDSFEYLFSSNLESTHYNSTRNAKRKRRFLVIAALDIMIVVCYIAILERLVNGKGIRIGLMPLGFASIFFINLWIQMIRNAAGVRMLLHPGWFGIGEVFTPRSGIKSRSIVRIKSKYISALNWVAGGLWIDTPRMTVRGTLVDNRLIQQPGAVKAIQKWAEIHKVQLNGVSPIADGMNPYPRPIETN